MKENIQITFVHKIQFSAGYKSSRNNLLKSKQIPASFNNGTEKGHKVVLILY